VKVPEKTSTPLETALVAAAFDPSSRPFFYRNLQQFDAYVASRRSSSPRSRISFIRIHRSPSSSTAPQPHVAVFSSPEMVPKEFSPVKMKLGEIFRVVRGTPVSLNPDQAATKDFSVDEIESILSGELNPTTAPSSESAWSPPPEFFSPPTPAQEECWDAVRALMRDHPMVLSCWAAEFGHPDSRGAAVWVAASAGESPEEAASECRVMLATLSDPPPRAMVSTAPPPPTSAKIYP
jgi:hypothetical protein